MKRRRAIVPALAVAVAAAVASTAAAGTAGSAAATQSTSCKSTFKIPVLTPYTGPAAFLGGDQGSWATLAVKQIAPKLGIKATIVKADTTLDPAVASTAVQKVLADKQVVAVVGPATSGGVAATSKALFDAKVAHVTPSATNAALTKGNPKTATPGFFRVVVDDSVQGTLGAKHIANTLKAKKVAVFDAQEPYSEGLANIVQAYLRGKGIAVQRFSVTNNTTDFSSIVNRIDRDTDVVYTPFQVAANAQNVAVSLREQGKSAVVFGTDGTADPAFKFPGSYVTLVAPDISSDPAMKALVDAWKKDNPGRTFSAFGPPAYGAVQVVLRAIDVACAKNSNTAVTRQEVFQEIKSGPVKEWIFGGSFRFSRKTNDPLNGSLWLYQIQSDGTQKQVAKLT